MLEPTTERTTTTREERVEIALRVSHQYTALTTATVNTSHSLSLSLSMR
jgi:hypothetical protein